MEGGWGARARVNEIERRRQKEREFENDVVQLLRRRRRGNQGDELSLQFFSSPLELVGETKISWGVGETGGGRV